MAGELFELSVHFHLIFDVRSLSTRKKKQNKKQIQTIEEEYLLEEIVITWRYYLLVS